jgi:hypothetical protein
MLPVRLHLGPRRAPNSLPATSHPGWLAFLSRPMAAPRRLRRPLPAAQGPPAGVNHSSSPELFCTCSRGGAGFPAGWSSSSSGAGSSGAGFPAARSARTVDSSTPSTLAALRFDSPSPPSSGGAVGSRWPGRSFTSLGRRCQRPRGDVTAGLPRPKSWLIEHAVTSAGCRRSASAVERSPGGPTCRPARSTGSSASPTPHSAFRWSRPSWPCGRTAPDQGFLG